MTVYQFLTIVALTTIFSSCGLTDHKSASIIVSKSDSINDFKTTPDTLPNGVKLLDNATSSKLYYKEVVGSDTLKGGYITCYGIDDSTKYFYLRHGDTLNLLNYSSVYSSTWSLGTLENDFDDFFIITIDNGNTVPPTYQVFNKKTAKNMLGDKVVAWNYKKYNDSLFFLYDNHITTVTDNYIYRKPADSIFLYNVTSDKREGFKLPSKVPDDFYIDLKKITSNILIISWRNIMTEDDEKLIKYLR